MFSDSLWGLRPTGWDLFCDTAVGGVCLSVIISCLVSSVFGWLEASFGQAVWEGERALLSPLNITDVPAGTRPAPFPGTAWFTMWKGKPKSPSNENIKVSAWQVRNLLPLTPINSYKTLVLPCLCPGTRTLVFIKLNFLFFFTRPVMCAGTSHHLLLSGLVHFPGLWEAEGTSILLYGTWYRRMK